MIIMIIIVDIFLLFNLTTIMNNHETGKIFNPVKIKSPKVLVFTRTNDTGIKTFVDSFGDGVR
jgi:hypothetical protein